MMELTFGSLNFKEAGSWPLWQRLVVYAVIIVAIVLIGVAVSWYPKYQELVEEQRKEASLKGTYTERKAKTVNHQLYIEQYDRVQRDLGDLVKNLPTRSEIDALLVDVNQAGVARGLQFDLFKPAPAEKKLDFYSEIPIDIKLSGDYHGMAGFVSDVAALPRVVTINDVVIEHNKAGVLTMSAVAKTFRYLDEQEQKSAPATQTNK
ncbi:MAG: type 4a pilus biogenesis protein PilO [Burkholderiales bacterium]|jgi:type IV pilus assembly protein PilO|nr:type 4a pilus biogenesis protein PilO [Burkholderiales bacterium]